MRVELAETAEEAARHGASLIADAARSATAERGAFALAVSGGSAPWIMFERLGDANVPWEATEIFQADERIAPDGDPDRNLTHLERSLPAAAVERLRPMPVTAGDLAAAASGYEASLPEELDLDRARRIFWLVTGEDKRDALSRLLAGDESIPAARVKTRDGLVIADRAAAG